jgi:hypothetical protein
MSRFGQTDGHVPAERRLTKESYPKTHGGRAYHANA